LALDENLLKSVTSVDLLKEMANKGDFDYDLFSEMATRLGIKTITLAKINGIEIYRVERKFRDVLEVFVEVEGEVNNNKELFLSAAKIKKVY
jgi:hypothetical protein